MEGAQDSGGRGPLTLAPARAPARAKRLHFLERHLIENAVNPIGWLRTGGSGRRYSGLRLTGGGTNFIISQRHRMKPATQMVLRFAASLFAYILLFATPFYPQNDLLQKYAIGSLAGVIVVLMVGVLTRRVGVLAGGFALVFLLPAAWCFSLLMYELSPVGSDRSKAEARELLTESVSVFKFKGGQSEIRRLLRKSNSLRYDGYTRYLDGGSMGFVFSNQEDKVFLVFVPNPYHGEGIGLEDGRKFQRILVVAKAEFSDDELLELHMGSRAEAKVIRLVRSSLQENLPVERREEIFLLLEILAERAFDWESFQKATSHSGLPRAKGR